jgi:hypothetical protein
VPYHSWLQFLRQKSSLLAQEYSSRAPRHSRWPDFRIYLPQDAATLIESARVDAANGGRARDQSDRDGPGAH